VANTISGFYQTIVAAATEASQALVYNLKAVDSVYMDYRSEAATIGQILNVIIPGVRTGNVQDQGTGDVNLTDVSETTVSIVFNKHPSDAFVIRDFEQYNSPTLLRKLFLDSAIKGIKENINANVCALFNTTNFTTLSAISGTLHDITTSQFLSGMAFLADQRVPIQNDPENVSLLVPSTVYTGMLADNNWTQAQIAGMFTAETVRRTGEFPTAFGATIKLDQQMPTTGAVGSRTFTAAYLHRWAVAVATRPLPAPDEKVVDYSYVDFMGIPIRITLGYNQYPKQGYILTVDAGYGLKVVRDYMCQLYSVSE
jgi:hypothetical protein